VNYIIENGELSKKETRLLKPDDHSYRYGDGLFETIKIVDGNIFLAEYHFERLFSGLELLKFKIPKLFTRTRLIDQISELCKRNDCGKLARIRLSVSRGSGGLYDCDNKLNYLIECWPLENKLQELNENGLIIDIYPDAMKTCDKFSNIKSANYLPYVMAAIWAKENKLNDALVLNQHQRICDATIANIFWGKDGIIYTPPLSEGCVAGVMRKKILETQIQNFAFIVKELVLTEDALLDADEIFLTNIISGIRWVKQCRGKVFSNKISSKIYSELL
jgi:branched-chain amino acid aminotransferase